MKLGERVFLHSNAYYKCINSIIRVNINLEVYLYQLAEIQRPSVPLIVNVIYRRLKRTIVFSPASPQLKQTIEKQIINQL